MHSANNQLQLIITKRTNPLLLRGMAQHYSKPKGFVGRNICYAILCDGIYYGHIVGGSAARFLPNRNEYFGIDITQLNQIVNNVFFCIQRVNGRYPLRNFVPCVLRIFRERISMDWYNKYDDVVIGFESLVEPPRTGDCYIRDKWQLIGQTKGYTCKRVAGKGTDSYSGKRVWDTQNLRPKLVFARKVHTTCSNRKGEGMNEELGGSATSFDGRRC